MASTYTTRLRLEKQGDGKNPNSWGLRLNQNVIDLVDQAVGGYAVVSVSSVAVTLTEANGATDQSRNASLEFAGTLTADVTVLVPEVEKLYFIRENTTGSFGVKLKTNTGSAISLQKSTNILVACDGTELYKLEAPTSVSAFTINTLTATSIDTSIINAVLVSATNGTFTSTVSATELVASTGTFATKVSTSALAVTGVVSAASAVFSGDVSASSYYGSGANLTNIPGPKTIIIRHGVSVSAEVSAAAYSPAFNSLSFTKALFNIKDKDTGSIASLNATTHEITLPAGAYKVNVKHAIGPSSGTNQCTMGRIYDHTHSKSKLIGLVGTGQDDVGSGSTAIPVVVDGLVSVSVSTSISFQILTTGTAVIVATPLLMGSFNGTVAAALASVAAESDDPSSAFTIGSIMLTKVE
jgi:hypothetical protein